MNVYQLIKKTSTFFSQTGAKIIRFMQFVVLDELFVPIALLFSFLLFFASYVQISQFVSQQRIFTLPLHVSVASYPFLTNKNKPDITAQAAVVMDDDSKVVPYAKNATLRFSPASTTKIMTFLTALSYYHLDDILEIKTAFVEGSIVGFSLGQKVTFKNLLYGMMLPSGNDAALAIAQNYPGGEDAFIAQMNQNVKKWHLYNTHFADPAGLLDDATYTTVIDLARLSSIAMKNPVFAQIVGTKAITIETIDGKNIFSIKNLNQLLGLYGIDGIKTGYTEEAQGVLVTSVMNENHRSIIVVMRSQDRFTDTISLIQSIVNNLTYLSMSS